MFKVHDFPDPGLADQSSSLSFLSWVQVIENTDSCLSSETSNDLNVYLRACGYPSEEIHASMKYKCYYDIIRYIYIIHLLP